jgi:hypothetical protein
MTSDVICVKLVDATLIAADESDLIVNRASHANAGGRISSGYPFAEP